MLYCLFIVLLLLDLLTQVLIAETAISLLLSSTMAIVLSLTMHKLKFFIQAINQDVHKKALFLQAILLAAIALLDIVYTALKIKYL